MRSGSGGGAPPWLRPTVAIAPIPGGRDAARGRQRRGNLAAIVGVDQLEQLLHLLGPNHRPQQVTSDLASFWKTTYAEVRKELRRRYPKHAWPDDPLAAPARQAKRSGRD